MVKVEYFFPQDKIFEQGRAARARAQRILIIGDANALIGRKMGIFFRVGPFLGTCWWVSPPVPADVSKSSFFAMLPSCSGNHCARGMNAVVAHSIASVENQCGRAIASVENQCGRAIKVPQRSIPVLMVSCRRRSGVGNLSALDEKMNPGGEALGSVLAGSKRGRTSSYKTKARNCGNVIDFNQSYRTAQGPSAADPDSPPSQAVTRCDADPAQPSSENRGRHDVRVGCGTDN